MHLVIDNYDSFTYNIVQYVNMIGARTEVRRHDDLTLDEIDDIAPQSIIISPGPCTPDEAGISIDAIRHGAGSVPMLGICLGHQCIAQAFGGRVRRADRPVHGNASRIRHDGGSLFEGLADEFMGARYHALVVDHLPPTLRVTARCLPERYGQPGEIMGLRHVDFPIYGLQFHPESILTQGGLAMIRNFVRIAERQAASSSRRAADLALSA